jgi:nucleotide-binding universal stress UspA family protein
MHTPITPLTRMLVPVDGLEALERCIPVISQLAQAATWQQATLLHVVAGSFLSSHMSNIDVRAGQIMASETIQRLRRQHIAETVGPLMDQACSLLDTTGLPLETRVKDGDPIKLIATTSQEGDYSTLIMSRRDPNSNRSIFMGSVTRGVIDRQIDATIYLVGEAPTPVRATPCRRCLIGVNDSATSRRAVAEAATLLSRSDAAVEECVLIHVVDQTGFLEHDGTQETGHRFLEEARQTLIGAGLAESKIKSAIHFGQPGRILIQEAEAYGATMLFIGRRDRTKLAMVLLGSVCGEIVHYCKSQTVVLVS